jgi:hypothetical protein
MKVSKTDKEKIKKIFSKIKIYTCSMCGSFLTEKEWKEFEGVCMKHWDM